MVGKKLILGEDRELLERYCLSTNEPKTFYSIECYVFHHAGPSKMCLVYQMRRFFASGALMAFLQNNRLMSGRLQNLRKRPPFIPGEPSREFSRLSIGLRGLKTISFFAGLYFWRLAYYLSGMLGRPK
jgi:hypothetical protein